MATFTYLSFSLKQGLLIENGGAWDCTGTGSLCSQSFANNAYGPIMITSTMESNGNGLRSWPLSLGAIIALADDEFKGATKIPSTISFNIQVTAQGGSPGSITLSSNVGGVSYTYPELQYNTSNPVSLTHSEAWASRPTKITLEVGTLYHNSDTSTVTLAVSDLTFVIHDVVYGTTSVAGPSSRPTSLASLPPSISILDSTSTSSTNNSTTLSHSTSFTTTTSGHQTIMGTIIRSSSNYGPQSSPSTPPNSSIDASMTASERAGVISSSLLGLILVLAGIAFWYWWRRRQRMTGSGKLLRADGQIEMVGESRMVNQEPWVPRPYRKRPYSPPATEIARVQPVQDRRVRPVEVERQQAIFPSETRSENASSYRLNLPPPAYSQITPRPSSISSVTT